MKQLLQILIWCFPIFSFGQTIFSNSIDGVNPNLLNPYTVNQIVDPNITATGIGRGAVLFGVNTNNRYNAKSWKYDALNPGAYFEFTITPLAGKAIDFVSFVFNGQTSFNGPTLFAFRSSKDNFASDIGVVTANGSTVSLSAATFQKVTSSITFRIYGWAAAAGTGTFSINDFKFNGVISCAKPLVPVLQETSINCTATSFDLNWPASLFADSYFIDVATDSDFVNYLSGYQNKRLGNFVTETISGVAAGSTYYVRLRSANTCETSQNSNIIKVASLTTVYDQGWSNGLPDANKKVSFLSDFNVDSSLEACSCQISDGVNVHVDSDAILKLEKELEILGTGTLIFENNASLVQVNDNAVNTGNSSYKRITSAYKKKDYLYWSTPVSTTSIPTTFLDWRTNHAYEYSSDKFNDGNGDGLDDEADNWTPVNTMVPAKGYIVMVPDTGATTATVTFKGQINNGIQKIPDLIPNRFYLIGNPYPSAVDADKFILANAGVIDGTLHFWTHNTAIQLASAITNGTAGSGVYAYTSDDYAYYNLTGGVSTSTAAKSDTNTVGGAPSGSIASTQGFFVNTNAGIAAGSEIVFNNSMRLGIAGAKLDNSQFFKLNNSKEKTVKVIEKSRVWLNLSNTEGAFKQTLVGYITGATNDNDTLFDGMTLDTNQFVDFYSMNQGKNLVIQGRELPFDSTDEVPLGYKTAMAGNFKISIDDVDGDLSNQSIYLKDKTTGNSHDLKTGSYSFTTEKGTFNDRFVLHYIEASKLGTDNLITKKKEAIVSVKNRQIKINSFDQAISLIKIYDLKGSLVYEKNKIVKDEFVIEDLVSSNQFLIVMIQLENGKWTTQEIILDN